MRKQVLFVQGAGEGAHEEDAKLAESLEKGLGPDYEVRFPLMPNEASPDPAAWKRRLAEELVAMGDGAILVGHSAGATTLVAFLAEGELKQRIAGVFLIAAPFCGDGGWQIEGFELPINLSGRLPSGAPIFLYYGRDDEVVPFAHLGLYAKALPQAVIRSLGGRNHQLNDDLSEVAADVRRLG
jgi:predicted alpha/beta hydrolase family esterase